MHDLYMGNMVPPLWGVNSTASLKSTLNQKSVKIQKNKG